MRIDIHRPSAINPGEYSFVGCEAIKIEGMDDALFIQQERARIRAHMERTGGTYSQHAHGGNCHVCGNANAIYTALFHHELTNVYIRVGSDCTEKMEVGADVFRRLTRLKDGVAKARLARAGKAKAQDALNAAGCGDAWAHFTCNTAMPMDKMWEENTIRDIVGKLVQYGSISDKQMAFVAKLLAKIADRPQIEAQRAAEHAAASEVPISDKRVTVAGKVLSMKLRDTGFGLTWKLTIANDDGYKLYGSLPKNLEGQVNKGDTIEFSGKIEPSRDDPKFGFWSRPTKGRVLVNAAEHELTR